MKDLFTEHPASVGETWFQHLCSAWYFAAQMLIGALACLLHGLLPCLLQDTGSRRIAHLHDRMIRNRARRPHSPAAAAEHAERMGHGAHGGAA